MRARVVIFPIKGRDWCFSRSLDQFASQEPSSTPQRLRDIFKNITSTQRSIPEKTDIVADFVSDKMSRAWDALEKAPKGTLKSKLHSLGLWLLSRVKPSEVFLKSISKDITEVEVTYPASLNPSLVRRRLRHIAMRGFEIHRMRLYGSVTLLPFTSVLTVLPLPNVPFFWLLFRAYSHWKALKGSERLLLLVSDSSSTWSLITNNKKGNCSKDESESGILAAPKPPWVMQPSEELEKFLIEWKCGDGVGSCSAIGDICEVYGLDKKHVIKYVMIKQ